MSRRLLLAFLLSTSVALAQDGAVSFAETDQAEYAYGETIELRYTITNEGDEPLTLSSLDGCVASFILGSLIAPGETGGCTQAEVDLEFPPGSSWTWIWQIIPAQHAVPEESGPQAITAFFNDDFTPEPEQRFAATATFSAPQYLGGHIGIGLVEGLTLDDIQDVLDALNAEIIHATDYGVYRLEIEGTTVFDAISAYESDERFTFIELSRSIRDYYFYVTDDEDSAAPLPLTLTAAHPNPFAGSTSFALTVPASGPARVEVFDLLGRRVAVLHDGPLAAGVEHHFTFHAADLPAGLYVVRATGKGFTETRRVTLAR